MHKTSLLKKRNKKFFLIYVFIYKMVYIEECNNEKIMSYKNNKVDEI